MKTTPTKSELKNMITNDTVVRWLSKNGPAEATVIAGHLAGGSESVARVQSILQTLRKAGVVEPEDSEMRPYRWQLRPSARLAAARRPFVPAAVNTLRRAA